MSHFTNICKHGMIVSQCRCPSFNKVHHIVECVSSPEHDKLIAALKDPLDGPESDSEALGAAEAYGRHAR